MIALTETFWTALTVAIVGAFGGAVVALLQKPSRDAAKRLATTTGDIKAEVTRNGGASMKDTIDRIDRRTAVLDERQLLMEQRQLSGESILHSLLESNNDFIVPEIKRLTDEVQQASERLTAHIVAASGKVEQPHEVIVQESSS